MASLINWLRGVFGSRERTVEHPMTETHSAEQVGQAADPASAVQTTPQVSQISRRDSHEEAQAYLSRVQVKLGKLANDFNAGTINRDQFQNLYIHYQREIRSIQGMIEIAPGSESWKGAVTEGESVIIRQQHLARAEGYAIFENDSGMPVSDLGRFELDLALLVPMLSSYRAATREIFGAGISSTEIEDGRWLCFVPGEFTTLLAVFSTEPAGKQLEYLDELHRHFEQANHRHLVNPPLDPSTLLFPHEYFLGEWKR